ncbi:MAG: L-seryl-tRNA(Sec) selenium transferase [Ruminococcaceae bacterium]|nr:L-seryl-tRNA(Sec) selenium transferase [Oscillospiraceae bacterium]
MRQLLRNIPKVTEFFDDPSIAELKSRHTPAAVTEWIRRVLEELRAGILAGQVAEIPAMEELCGRVCALAHRDSIPSLRPVVNGTGVVLHTNLGRGCLSERAADAVRDIARSYSTLEYDPGAGCRGSRHIHVEQLLCRLTGAESAMVVNNNAAAVMLILGTLAQGGEVITSRGELVEIGGSFRVPDVMELCGCRLREVGTTNKTHLYDYERAINEDTRALLKVHTSNYRIVGFTESLSLEDIVALGRRTGLPVVQDLGSGSLVDLERYGIHDEPTVQHSIRAGVDVVSFSGDKLLGGPQAGVILGKKEYIDRMKKHPLARALRVDKMTLAALSATLSAYQDTERAEREIPVLAMLATPRETLRAAAEELRQALLRRGVEAEVTAEESPVGGGSVPTQLLPTWAVAVLPGGRMSVNALEEALRRRERPIVGRISAEQYLLDVRTIDPADFVYIAEAAAEVLP